MIDTQSIRSNLLEAAIHGELTDNRDDASLDSILSEINNQYRSLLSQKNTKEIVDSPMISEDLFELPDTWAWVPLRQLCIFLSRGKSPKYSETAKYPVFAQKCNQPAGLALERALFLDETTLDKWQEFFRLQDGDILINSTGTGTMGRVGYYESVKLNPEYPFMVPDSHVTVARVGDGLVSKYAYYALRSPSLQKIMEKQFRGTTNQKEFYINSAAAMPIPLPPPTVQERIVEVLDSSLEFLQIIDQLQTQYADNLTVLKSKLIDAAIQGKLTAQLPEDGTAEEMYQIVQIERKRQEIDGTIKQVELAPEITDKEKPFDIPKTWKWTHLGNICYIVRGGSPRPIKEYITTREDGINWIKIGDVEKGGKYIYSTHEKIIPEGESKSRRVYPGDFLLTNSMSFGRPYISKIEGCIHDGWLLIHGLNGFDQDYLYYLLSSKYLYNQFTAKASGSTVENLNIDKVKAAIIPLPPLAEQKRIVARLDQALAMIEV